MNKAFLDHSFNKIVEISHDPQFARVFVEGKLRQLEEVAEVIRSSEGEDSPENVLNYRLTHRAFSQCLDYINNPSSVVTETDYYIYYSFLATALQKAEQIIDDELAHLEL
ncbi:Uncharacterised protein [BD1-7 clade bacterium]|uniref:HEPN domain-containing protein n=1 Tax=BD1-7 clade bacterium TaxID=2029982 RepID=A0A5S9N661_9GAMM|nr:Uncharacterised protein [BD1-7 clade bacterium]CAA0084580.1 Uncharacterised protein [BD1-7 clade bacterium]